MAGTEKDMSQSLPGLVLLSQIFDPATTLLIAQLKGLLETGASERIPMVYIKQS